MSKLSIARRGTLFDFPPEIRRVIYTTNAIESVNSSIRKLTTNGKITRAKNLHCS